MGTHATTRRMFLGAVAVAPVAMVPAMANTMPGREFATLHAAYLSATKAELAYSDDVSEPAATAYSDSDAVAAIPNVTARYHDAVGKAWTLRSNDKSDVAIAQAFPRETDQDACLSTDFGQACRDVVAGAEIKKAETARLRHSTGYDKADKRQSDLSGKQTDATRALIACPARTMQDLLLKMEVVVVEDWITDEGIYEHILADVRRLGGC